MQSSSEKNKKNMQTKSDAFEKKRSGNRELHVRHNSSVIQPYSEIRKAKMNRSSPPHYVYRDSKFVISFTINYFMGILKYVPEIAIFWGDSWDFEM